MRALIIILSILWFLFGWFACKNKICNAAPKETVSSVAPVGGSTEGCITTLVFKEKNGRLDLASSENFQFEKSSAVLIDPSTDLVKVMEKVQAYLKDNEKRFIQLTGQYLPDESNNSDYENLGLARAAGVKSYLMEMGINSSQLQIAGKANESTCSTENKVTKGITAAFGDKL